MTTTAWRAHLRRALVTTALLAGAVLPLRGDGIAPVNGRTAIHGYDPVAYFTQSKAVKGSREFRHEWNGATWLFSSQANRDAFAASPERYAPQYGGYCAYGVGQGYTVDVDPEAWSVVDGKLFLNYSQSVRTRWEKDKPGYITKADANWPKLLRGEKP